MFASLRFNALNCIVLFALQQVATGLKCYECYDCSTPTNLITVDSGYSCTKTATLVGGRAVYVTRGFSPSNICYEYQTVLDGTGYYQTCCTTDACNRGITPSSSSSSLTLLLLLSFLFFKS